MAKVKKTTKSAKSESNKKPASDSKWAKFSLFFFDRVKLTFALWLVLVTAGILSFTTLLKREGFPAIQFPLTVVSGSYLVDDQEVVDQSITQPLSEELLQLEEVTEVQSNAGPNFFQFVVSFEQETDPKYGTQLVQDTLSGSLPDQAQTDFVTIDPASYLNEYDLLLTVSADSNGDLQDLERVATIVADSFESDNRIDRAEVQSLFSSGFDPSSGQSVTIQSSFNQIVIEENDEFVTRDAIIVGVDRNEELDIIELSNATEDIIGELNQNPQLDGFDVRIGADFADSIETQISSLQSNLLMGLLAVSIITMILITWRASIITALFMVTVVLTTLFVLLLAGFTINTITLFALILSLGLFVDDATIIVEAIDANDDRKKSKREVVKKAIAKVASASFAGTTTTVLVFIPLAFVTGILGEFIRLLPITVIIALISSLLLSLALIPFLARGVLLRPRGAKPRMRNPMERVEKIAAKGLASLPLMLRTRPVIGRTLAAFFILLSIGMIAMGGYFSSQLTLNIFPPSKDSNELSVSVTYPPNTTIEQAQSIANKVDEVIIDELGENMKSISYGLQGLANNRSASSYVELISYEERDVTSRELMDQVQSAVDEQIGDSAQVFVRQIDSGPPSAQLPFKVQVFDEDGQKATALAQEIATFLNGQVVERQNGTTATIDETSLSYVSTITRLDGRRVVQVDAGFDDDDTTALVEAAQQLVEEQYPPEVLVERGFSEDALGFDFGFESDNAESFNSLGIVYPIALLAMFILLAIQFRSILQPLLIFMAIPFSFFGVTGGLLLTDNVFSFFVQVGFIGLIGIAVNNTILLTDYANQERREGKGLYEAVSAAAEKRFRPLITTSLTTVVALLPLALADPFWEPLAYTIIFGLLSSTFLVLVSFPYYYIVMEAVRRGLNRFFNFLSRPFRRAAS